LSGSPLQVVEVRRDMGHTPIPRNGVVLSFGGLDPGEPLSMLLPGVRAEISTQWKVTDGTPVKQLEEADAIVNGAGLLRRKGKSLTNWDTVEALSPANFINMRHPRTLIGLDRHGNVWLAAIDGRQPGYSVGMHFADLNRLCDRLELTDALNLDGGGSTTMVVQGRIVNKPSDATGPRPVSDAILVESRIH
jgi:hypothetical protein